MQDDNGRAVLAWAVFGIVLLCVVIMVCYPEVA